MTTSTSGSRGVATATVRPPILLVGHGSRSATATQEFMAIVDAVRSGEDGLVVHAFLEHQSPFIDETLAALLLDQPAVVVAPIFLFVARHLRVDIPNIVEGALRQRPTGRVALARELGTHPAMLQVALQRLSEQSPTLLSHGGQRTRVLVLGRGSREASALADFQRVRDGVAAALPHARVEPAYADLSRPSLDEALEGLPGVPIDDTVIVLPYLLFAGALVDQVHATVRAWQQRHPRPIVRVARHLGVDDAIVPVAVERIRQACDELRA